MTCALLRVPVRFAHAGAAMAVIEALTKASVANFAVLSPVVCVVAVMPFANTIVLARSADTRARKVGVAFAPDAGPISAVFATWEIRDSVTAPADNALLYITKSHENDVTPPAAGIGTNAD